MFQSIVPDKWFRAVSISGFEKRIFSKRFPLFHSLRLNSFGSMRTYARSITYIIATSTTIGCCTERMFVTDLI